MQFPLCEVPGATVPQQPSKAYQLKRITERVQASQAVVALLCELAFGTPNDWTEFPIARQAPGMLAEARR